MNQNMAGILTIFTSFALEAIIHREGRHQVLFGNGDSLSDEPRIKKIPKAFFRLGFPTDLKVALLWLAACIIVSYLPTLNETPIRAILILPVMLFLPGYCLIAALFPKNSDIDLIQRIALAFGISIAIVPLIVLWLHFTQFGIGLDSILFALSVFILVMILIAHIRRALLPSEDRFGVLFFEIAGELRNAIFSKGGSRVNHLVTVVLALVVIAALLATVYLITVPQEGERFSEFFILGENRTAANYPDKIIAGKDYPMYVGLGNHEYRDINYTIEIWMLRTEFNPVTNTSHIIAMDPKDRLSLTLGHNETTIIPYNLSIKKTGYDRVEFLLFNESVSGLDVNGSERINASYRYLHLWVTIEEA